MEIGVRPFHGDWLPIDKISDVSFFNLGEVVIQ